MHGLLRKGVLPDGLIPATFFPVHALLLCKAYFSCSCDRAVQYSQLNYFRIQFIALFERFYCRLKHHLPLYGLGEKEPLQAHDAGAVGG